MSRLDDLIASPLFRDLPADALHEAARAVTERRFRPGQALVEQDAEGEALHLITSGVVRVSRVSLGSRERVMGDVYAPGVIGEMAVLAPHSERSATVRALTEVSTLMLHRAHFQQLLRRHPQLLWNLSAMLVARISALNDELIAFGLNTETALIHVFLNQYQQRVAAGVPNPHVLPLTVPDIMGRTSSSRETVARVMKKLAEQGLLTATGIAVTLLAPNLLESASLEEQDAEA